MQQQQQQQQQQRQTRDVGGGGPRHSLSSPFSTHPPAPYEQPPQPQQPTGFLQYPLPTEPNYNQLPIAQPQQQMSPSGRYWQAPPVVDTSRRHGSLDLAEFGGILDSDAASTGNEYATGEAAPSEAASEMSTASFSNHDGMTGSVGLHPTVAMSSKSGKPPDTVKPNSKSSRTVPPSSDLETQALVDAAYAQANDSPNGLDLRLEKLSKGNRNEKCQYQDCPNRARVSQSYGKFCNRHVIVAPCGFPGCREKAMDRAAMCVKHMELGQEPLKAILDARTQNVPVCKMSGCFKNDQGRGYCRGHEKLLMATGRLPPHVSKRRMNSAYTMCSYPDCSKHSQRHHLCRTHGNLLNKQAQELADRPGAAESYEEILSRMQKEIRRCTHENCTKNSQRDRLCTTHYYEKHNPPKDGSSASETSPRERAGSKARRADNKDIQAVERTRCTIAGCGNLSYAAGLCVKHTKENQNLAQTQGRYGDLYSSEEGDNLFAGNADSETKPGLLIQSEKAQASGAAVSPGVTAMTSTTHSKCTNPMCDRESFGRDYCEACQRLFSPLVVSINPIASGYTSGGQLEEKVLLCRVSDCGQDCVRGGLCAAHLRAFRTGSLSVDNLKLDSQAQQREQELAEAAAVAAAAAEATPASPGKSRKYYCKVDGCGNLAQKRNMCKRHYRLQEGVLAGDSPNSAMIRIPVPPLEFSHPHIRCQFPSCSQFAYSGSLLCLAHSKATFCWQPGCENLVDLQQFCEFHAFRQQCAYEGCMYTAQRGSSGCANHSMAPKCRHEFCDKFAVGSDNGWCRLHQISCQDAPCMLCKLHALASDTFSTRENENSSWSRNNAGMPIGDTHGNLYRRLM